MGWIDKVPRAGELYIGGLHALYQRQDLFKEARINHILSVIDLELYEDGHFQEYSHMQVKLDDDPNENLLQHFGDTTRFIDSALENRGAVFVHCAMGKSRSATVVCAYLVWKYGITPAKALEQLCEGRPVCSPNPGFMEQLHVFYLMIQAGTKVDADKVYKEWLNNRFTGDLRAWERRRINVKL